MNRLFEIPIAPLVMIFAGMVDLALAAGIYFYVQKLARKCAEVRRRWKELPGKILSSRLKEKSDGEGGILYSPQIRYEYSIGGQRYESERLTVYPEWSSSNRRPHQEFVARFPRDKDVAVFVDPENPANAVLTADPPPPAMLRLIYVIMAVMGALLLAAGPLLLIFWPRFPFRS